MTIGHSYVPSIAHHRVSHNTSRLEQVPGVSIMILRVLGQGHPRCSLSSLSLLAGAGEIVTWWRRLGTGASGDIVLVRVGQVIPHNYNIVLNNGLEVNSRLAVVMSDSAMCDGKSSD